MPLRQMSFPEWIGAQIYHECHPRGNATPTKSPIVASSKICWLNFHLAKYNIIEDGSPMARKQAQWQQVEFFNAALDKSDKIAFEKWTKLETNEFHERIGNEVALGWKVSVSWDDDNQCYIGAMTQRLEGHINYNLCITSRSDIMWEAIALCAYKIDKYKANETRLSGAAAKNNWG